MSNLIGFKKKNLEIILQSRTHVGVFCSLLQIHDVRLVASFCFRSEVLLLIFLGFCDYETMKNLKAYVFYCSHRMIYEFSQIYINC